MHHMSATYLSAQAAAELIGMTKRRVNQLIADGELIALRIGNANAVEAESIDKYLSKRGRDGSRPRKAKS